MQFLGQAPDEDEGCRHADREHAEQERRLPQRVDQIVKSADVMAADPSAAWLE